jgi:hypothetical protein
MKPVPREDRHKLVMVSVAIVVAGSSGVRSLLRTTVRAESADTEKIAACSLALPVATVSTRAASAEDSSSHTCLNTGSDAGSAAAAGSESEADAERDAGRTETPAAPNCVRDPFRPLTGTEIAERPAATPVAAAPAVPAPATRPPAVPVPVLPCALPAPPEPPDQPTRADNGLPKPPVEAKPGAVDLPVPQPSMPPGQSAPPAAPITLIGTVGDDRSAVAVFRVGDKTLFLRPMDAIAGSRVKRIEMGQVWLSCNNVRQLVRVGDEFKG